MKSKIIRIIILLIFLSISCKNSKIDTIEEYIQKIDNVPVGKVLYVFEVDSSKNILDTLMLRTLKYDDNKNLIFENNIQLKSNISTINYYNTKKEIIYSKVEKDNKIFSDFKVNLKKGLIISANYNVYGKEIKNTVFMKYYYTFEKKKKVRLRIDSGDDYNTIELYNEFEKPTLNFSIYKKDTLEKTSFLYDKNNLIKIKKVKNLSRNEEFIYEYDKGFMTKESFFKNSVCFSYTNYYKDKQGNYLSYTTFLY